MLLSISNGGIRIGDGETCSKEKTEVQRKLSDQTHLRIPGPVPVPHKVLMASASPMINHRGKQFKEKLPAVLERLKYVFQTKNTVLALTGSGTAAMEAAVANLVNPGDPVLVLVGGTFGQRWANICNAYQGKVYELEFPWGQGVEPQLVRDFLLKHPEIKIVFATHNESSTGVLNDIEAIGRIIRETQALFVVDAVSSLGGVMIQTDKWGIDIVCTASQKCLMVPPGLAFLSVSQRAKERMLEVKSPRFYLDLKVYEDMLAKGEPPYTPNLANFFAIEESLKLIEAEGLNQIFARHILMRDMIRIGLEAIGLTLLVEEQWASPTVTAVRLDLMNVDEFIKELRDHYGVEVAGGQGELAGKIFRIGHMGHTYPLEMLTTLAAIESCLGRYGQAVAAAEKLWIKRSSQ